MRSLAFWWWAYIALIVAAASLRARADGAGFPVHGAEVETLLFGTLPSAWLQAHILHLWPDGLAWASVAVHASWFAVCWFALPVAVTFLAPGRFGSLIRWMIGLYAVALTVFALFPLEPPWMASDDVTRLIAWKTGEIQDSNAFAAMPSLHVALPLVQGLWCLRQGWKVPGLALAAYSGLVAVEVVFSGEHYVMDVLGAIAVAALVAALARIDLARLWSSFSSSISGRDASQGAPRLKPALEPVPLSRQSDRGQVLLELVLVLPVIFIFILLIVDFGIALDRRQIAQNAVREGARYGATGKTIAETKDLTWRQSKGLLTTSNVEVCYVDSDNNGDAGNEGDRVRVDGDFTYEFFVASGSFFGMNLGGWSIDMSPSAESRLEVVVQAAPEC